MEQFFTKSGRPISAHEALDSNGIMRDGVISRTRLSMRDHDSNGPTRIVDGAMHRPGFRFAVDAKRKRTTHYDPKGRMRGYSEEEEETEDAMSVLDAAYDTYHRDLENAYRGKQTCPHCDGRGVDLDSGDDCSLCHGTGLVCANVATNYETSSEQVVSNASTHHESGGRDHRSVQDHQTHMDRVYSQYDAALSKAWRQR